MKYAGRALGWAIKILWIMIIIFSISSVYSAFNVRIGFNEPKVRVSDGAVILSMPLFVNNSGLYDLFALNITTNVRDSNDSLLGRSTMFIPLVSKGNIIETTHNISIDFEKVISQAQTYMFNDTFFNVDLSAGINFANVIPLQLASQQKIPWGAPFHNFTIEKILINPINSTHLNLTIPIRFENHSTYFGLEGLTRIEVYNEREQLLGSTRMDLDVPSHSRYTDDATVTVNVMRATRKGTVRLWFETSSFTFGPVMIPYG